MHRKLNTQIGSSCFSKMGLALSFALATIVSVAPSFAQAQDNDESFVDSDAVVSVLAMMPGDESAATEEGAGAPGEPRGEGMHGEGGWHHHGGFHEFVSSLTDDQLGQLHSLKNNFLDAAGPKFVELKSKERHLKDALLAPTVDGGQAKSLQSDISSLKSEIASLKIDNEIAMAKVITPDQRKILRDEMYRHHLGEHHGGEHHHKGM